MVISILMVIIGLVAMSGCHRAVSQHRPPEIQVKTTYTGADAITVEQSWPRHRTADVRRGQHELHVFPQCQQRTDDLYVNFDVKTDPTPIKSCADAPESAESKCRQTSRLWCYGAEVHFRPLIMFALYSPNGTMTASFSPTILTSHQRPDDRVPHRSVTVFVRAVFDAFLGETRPARQANITIPEIVNASKRKTP